MSDYQQVQPTTPQQQISLEWVQPSGLIPLSLKIFLLRIITLGIYHFWGKTEVRRKIWSAVKLEGQPLQYTGTGWELFLGFLIAIFLIILPIYAGLVALILVFGDQSPAAIIGQLIFVIFVIYLVGVAQYRARNYRLSRTNWRGIRGHMAGSSWVYGAHVLLLSFLVPLTLGWIIPWMDTRLNRILTNETHFGTMPMRFSGSAGPLYGPFAVMWVGAIAIYAGIGAAIYYFFGGDFMQTAQTHTPPSPAMIFGILLIVLAGGFLLGIIGAWYQSQKLNYFARRTSIDRANFRLETTAGGIIWIFVSNLLIVLFTIGILTPIAQSRLASYIVRRMSIDGMIDFASIQQSEAALSRTGEGLAEAFDIDAF